MLGALLTFPLAAGAATAPRVVERSVGSPTDGHLIGGIRIEESPALRRYPCYGDDDVRYGLSSLVGAIERAAREVHRRFPDAVLSVGHLSRHGGGEVDRHASHESGRDADVGFYVKGAAGKPLLGERMVAFQGDGTASSWPGAHFDDARNWAFVSALLGDGHVRVSHLFIASPLRARLLQFAARSGAPAGLRNHAAEVLMQPHGALPHDDHFHVRVSCPPGMIGCLEFPTRPKWRKVAPARGKSGQGSPAGRGQAHSHPPTTELTPPPRVRPGHEKPPVETEDVDPAAPSIDLPVPVDPPPPSAAPPGAAPGAPGGPSTPLPQFVPRADVDDDVDGVLE